MKKLFGLLIVLVFHTNVWAKADDAPSCPNYLQTTKQKLHSSQTVNLCELTQGKPVLIVNTASNCGYTPHFKQLEAIHKKYQKQGLVVIGFPSDDFFQEEDDEQETAKICYINYGVTFTMLSTSAVRGSDANDVFQYLSDKATSPKWNFYKYLVDGKGKTVQAFSPRVSPDSDEFIQALEATLAESTLSNG
ncbi:glutathione peroxidase [Thalassotalea sediminis]|uniref:glutathione peroxidase n=1 Tax=Thalassotalea sediminis TaxID=1759089 RepID=UPI00257300FE|nr:glutathione peroxidase [Thalassotalea sediminis]